MPLGEELEHLWNYPLWSYHDQQLKLSFFLETRADFNVTNTERTYIRLPVNYPPASFSWRDFVTHVNTIEVAVRGRTHDLGWPTDTPSDRGIKSY